MTLTLDLVDTWGRPVEAEIDVRRDTVEIRCREEVVGVQDRDQLRDWLNDPSGVWAYDDLAWLACGNGVALAIDDVVPAFVLADHVLTGLRDRV